MNSVAFAPSWVSNRQGLKCDYYEEKPWKDWCRKNKQDRMNKVICRSQFIEFSVQKLKIVFEFDEKFCMRRVLDTKLRK